MKKAGVEKMEELVKFCFIAENKKADLTDLIGPITKMVHYDGKSYIIVTSVSIEDIISFIDQPLFRYV